MFLSISGFAVTDCTRHKCQQSGSDKDRQGSSKAKPTLLPTVRTKPGLRKGSAGKYRAWHRHEDLSPPGSNPWKEAEAHYSLDSGWGVDAGSSLRHAGRPAQPDWMSSGSLSHLVQMVTELLTSHWPSQPRSFVRARKPRAANNRAERTHSTTLGTSGRRDTGTQGHTGGACVSLTSCPYPQTRSGIAYYTE